MNTPGYPGGWVPRKQRPTFDTLARDLGGVDLRALPSAFDEYAGILRNTPSRTGKRLSNASTNRLRSMARAALNLAVESRYLEENPLIRSTWRALREHFRNSSRAAGSVTDMGRHIYVSWDGGGH